MKDTPSRASATEPRPDPDWVRGRCPDCGEVLVSNAHWNELLRRYFIAWECWNYLLDKDLPAEQRRCNYRRAL